MIKNFILDTNVLLHNPQALYSFADNTVIIPITVIEELDKFKSFTDRKGMHARQVLREIDGCIKKGALNKGAKIKSGGSLRIDLGIAEKIQNLPQNMDFNANDNKILSSAYDLQKKGETVFFISKDLNARIKAEALGIKARDFEKQKVEYSSLYKGWKEVNINTKLINQLYENGEVEVKGYTFYENEFALLKANDSGNSSAICKYDSIKRKVVLLKDSYEAMQVFPLNLEQKFAFDLLLNDSIKLVTLIGLAGTGKTLIALASALSKTLKQNVYSRILVARPIIPLGKDIGFLPGSKDEKMTYWMQPIFDNLEYILNKSAFSKDKNGEVRNTADVIDQLVKSNHLEIEALTYIRGRSIPNQFIIIDEAQNLTPHEIKTIISRVGDGTKIVLTGDPEQIDNPYLDANSNGLTYMVEHLKDIKIVGHMFLSKSERSEIATLAAEKL
ncbi:MAG: PhoH family protein [Spirochaetes bacterium]|nr:PhoH family protein [Spirochaetota bacterium]